MRGMSLGELKNMSELARLDMIESCCPDARLRLAELATLGAGRHAEEAMIGHPTRVSDHLDNALFCSRVVHELVEGLPFDTTLVTAEQIDDQGLAMYRTARRARRAKDENDDGTLRTCLERISGTVDITTALINVVLQTIE